MEWFTRIRNKKYEYIISGGGYKGHIGNERARKKALAIKAKCPELKHARIVCFMSLNEWHKLDTLRKR